MLIIKLRILHSKLCLTVCLPKTSFSVLYIFANHFSYYPIPEFIYPGQTVVSGSKNEFFNYITLKCTWEAAKKSSFISGPAFTPLPLLVAGPLHKELFFGFPLQMYTIMDMYINSYIYECSVPIVFV